MSDQQRDPSQDPDEPLLARKARELNERLRATGVPVEVGTPESGASKTLIATFIPAPRVAAKTGAPAAPEARDGGDGPGGADGG